MSFARNFAAGQQIAQNAMDTFNTARRNRDLRRIADARPEEISGFSEADADQMRAMSQAINPETGQPYYQFEDNGQGGLNVRNNFSYEGADGQMVAPGSTLGLRQRPLTEFLGRRYEAPLSDDQMEAARYRAMAGVMGREDPMLGMRMRRELRQDERDDWRFGVEQQRAPLQTRQLEQSVRTGDIQLGQAQRGLNVQSAEDAAMTMPADEVRSTLTGYLNTNRSDIPLLVLGQTKDGFIMADRNPQTGEVGPQFTVPLSVGRKLVVGMQLAEQGFGREALQYLSGVDENITALIDRYNRSNMDNARLTNDALGRQFGLDTDRARLGLQARETEARITALNNAESRAPRELRPETVEALNDLRDRISQEADPARRRQLENDWNRLYSMASTELGRVVMPRSQAEIGPLDKERLTAYFRALENLGPSAPQGQVDALAARFGVTHLLSDSPGGLPTTSRFGGSRGLPGWGGNQPAPTDGRASATPSTGVSRPIPAPNITQARPQFGNPANFERRSERGLFGGVNYFYYDPATRRRLSVEEYNRLTGGQ